MQSRPRGIHVSAFDYNYSTCLSFCKSVRGDGTVSNCWLPEPLWGWYAQDARQDPAALDGSQERVIGECSALFFGINNKTGKCIHTFTMNRVWKDPVLERYMILMLKLEEDVSKACPLIQRNVTRLLKPLPDFSAAHQQARRSRRGNHDSRRHMKMHSHSRSICPIRQPPRISYRIIHPHDERRRQYSQVHETLRYPFPSIFVTIIISNIFHD